MLRVFCICLATVFATPIGAATLPFFIAETPARAKLENDPFQDVLNAHHLSYRAVPGPAPFPAAQIVLQLPLLMAAGLWITLALPCQRRGQARANYAALAAWARSRMR